MNSINCFYLERSDVVELSLRRYCSGARVKCATSGLGYHDRSVIVELVSIARLAERGWPMNEIGRPAYVHDAIQRGDPRWPRSCSCGYRFAERDAWQCNVKALYRRSDNGELVTLDKAPAGAMWNAEWADYKGPDGNCLAVRVPGGFDWLIDRPTRNVPGALEVARHRRGGKIQKKQAWTRKGKVPAVTVEPGLLIPGKGQWILRSGRLEELS